MYQKEYQLFLRNWLSLNTLNDSILLYHGIGTGKTCTSIGITEGFKEYLNGLGKRVVVVSSQTLKSNFIDELKSKCTNDTYLTESEREDLAVRGGNFSFGDIQFKQKQKDIQTRVDKAISKYYRFETYESVIKTYKGSDLSDTVLVIDEAHNISGSVFSELREILVRSYNYRLILLSGTPVYDNCDQILTLSNLLNVNDSSRQIDPEKFSTRTTVDGSDTPFNVLTPGSLEALHLALRNKVSYVPRDYQMYPEKILVGKELSPEYKIKVIKCMMSDKHAELYDAEVAAKTLQQTLRIRSNQIGDEGTKLTTICDTIKESSGKSFVFTFYRETIAALEKILQTMGFQSYSSNSRASNRYIVLDGETGANNITSLTRAFNAKNNTRGEKIKVVLGTMVVSEGITLNCIRHTHIVEPHWNESRMQQVVGRAIRTGAHNLLPPGERNTRVYRYISVKNTPGPTIDEIVIKTAYLKSIQTAKVLRLLKEISIDCNLNSNTPGINGDVDCDYVTCKINCASDPATNYSSPAYNLGIRFFDEFQIAEIKKFIIQLFKTYFVWEEGHILSLLSKRFGKVSRETVYIVLGDLIRTSERITDVYRRTGFVIRRGAYYIFNADTISIDSSVYVKTSCDIQIQNTLIFQGEPQTDDHARTSTPARAKPSSKRNTYLSSRHVYGIKSGDEVLLCFKTEPKLEIDQRTRCTGRRVPFKLSQVEEIQRILQSESDEHDFTRLVTTLQDFLVANRLHWKRFSDIDMTRLNRTLLYLQIQISALAAKHKEFPEGDQLARITEYFSKWEDRFVPYVNNEQVGIASVTKATKAYLTANNFVSEPSSASDDNGLIVVF